MKPLKLDFQAFGPYKDEEHIDFERLSNKGLFLICGETGSGKTMMLDAMTFALYGKSSGGKRNDFESMRCTKADFDMPTYVRFTFEAGNAEYIFERRLERKRKNLSKSYDIKKKDEDGVFRTILENPKESDLNKKAVELIGLEYEQFRQVIILPQGQFEQFLTSDSDEKEKILSDIFGEYNWQLIAEKMYEEASNRRTNLRNKIEANLISLREEKCENLAQLNELIDELKKQLKQLEEEHLKENHEEKIKLIYDKLSLIKRFGDLDKANEQIKQLGEIKFARDESEKNLNNAKRAENVRQFITDCELSQKELQKRKSEYEVFVNEEAKLLKEADDALILLNNHIELEKEVTENKKSQAKLEAKKDDYSSIESLICEAEKLESEYAKLNKLCETDRVELERASKLVEDLNNQYTEAVNEHLLLNKKYIADITGFLADGLEEGDMCPVCGSTHHPKKAEITKDSVTRQQVEKQKEAADLINDKKNDAINRQLAVKEKYDSDNLKANEAKAVAIAARTKAEEKKAGLIDGIDTLDALVKNIEELEKSSDAYYKKKEQLEANEKSKREALAQIKAKKETALKEVEQSTVKYEEKYKVLNKGLTENGFNEEKEVRELLMSANDIELLQKEISQYDADVKSISELISEISAELSGKEKPDETECNDELNKANEAIKSYTSSCAKLDSEIKRLLAKYEAMKKDGEETESLLLQAENDWTFAKKLRGETGTGLQRYVLGILFSSVISAANKMLELVHDGRYRLYRSDERDKSSGKNKRGLELKAYDKYSDDPDGRFVNTLSGGEKFLASLALSIGMSTIAQKSGIRIQALFIDEGFGSLDENSIVDAMNVLNSIQAANGLVGIISHVQILQERIPTKLIINKSEGVSTITETVG